MDNTYKLRFLFKLHVNDTFLVNLQDKFKKIDFLVFSNGHLKLLEVCKSTKIEKFVHKLFRYLFLPC